MSGVELSAFVRGTDRSAARLTAPVTTDLLGTDLRYYAVIDGAAHLSSSVRALARLLGRVTLNPLAPVEALAFGFVLRDETVVREIRSIPPHSTLHPDGTLTSHEAPRTTARTTDAALAVRRLRGVLEEVIAELEPRFDLHLAGFTGGKDSRILAALPKAAPGRWHWLSVSGRDDAEHRGSQLYAAQLRLEHAAWMEWTGDFLDGGVHRISADLANGVGAASDYTLLRANFERYRATLDGGSSALWIGTLADALLAGTALAPPADNLWDALAPRTAHLPRLFAPQVLAQFEEGAYRTKGDARLLRLLSRGRSFVCKGLASLDRVCPTQVNPYLHPALVELGLELDPRLLESDALRRGLLADLGPGLDGPSAFGYRAPAYAEAVFRALAEEARRCAPLGALVQPALLDDLHAGRFPELSPSAAGAGPAYRSHAAEPQPVVKSLRDYEHLLMYVTMVNLLAEDGVLR